MLLLLLLPTLISCVFGSTHQKDWCGSDNNKNCKIAYMALDIYLDHVISWGTCTFEDDKRIKIEVHKKEVEVRQIKQGAYLCTGQPETTRLYVFKGDSMGPHWITIIPMLPSVHMGRGTYTAVLSMNVPETDPFFKIWLASVKDSESASKIILNGKHVHVKEGHEGFVRIIPPYDHRFLELQHHNSTMKLNEGFTGIKGIVITSLDREERYSFTLADAFADGSRWCVDGKRVCYITYADLDKYLSHFQTSGHVQYEPSGQKLQVAWGSPHTNTLSGGTYKVLRPGVSRQEAMILYKTFPGKISIVFEPQLSDVAHVGSWYTAYVSLEVDPANPHFQIWLKSAEVGSGSYYIYVNNRKVYVKENHDGRPYVTSADLDFLTYNRDHQQFKIKGTSFAGQYSIIVTTLHTRHTFSFRIAEPCRNWFKGEFSFPNLGSRTFTDYCSYVKNVILQFGVIGEPERCTVPGLDGFSCSRKRGGYTEEYMIKCQKKVGQDRTRELKTIPLTLRSPYCWGRMEVDVSNIPYPDYNIILTPDKAHYEATARAFTISLKSGDFSEHDGFYTRFEDNWGNTLADYVGNVGNLETAFCRKSVRIVSIPKTTKTTLRRTVQLNPIKTFSCTEKVVYVTQTAPATKHVRLCHPERAADQATLKTDEHYAHLLRDSKCQIQGHAKHHANGTADFSVDELKTAVYAVDCQLFDCRWKFKVNKTLQIMKLFPEQPTYEQGPNMKIKLQVCLGPHCRSSGLKANLIDAKGYALMEGFSDSFTLNNIFCLSTVTITATAADDPGPVQRTVALRNYLTYICKKEIFVSRDRIREPIVLCSPTTKETKAALAKEEEFERIFKDAKCKCSRPGVTFSTRFLHLPSNASSSDNFSIHCQLHECQWSFLVRVVKEEIHLSPESDQYDPRNNTPISLRLCAGDVCRSTGINITIVDKHGSKLLEARKSSFSLYGFFCRSSVDLICQADGEPEASNRTLRLHPLLTPECSRQDVYVAPGARTKPVRICNIMSRFGGESLASDSSEGPFERMFGSVECTSEPQGNLTFAKAHVQISPNVRPPVEYLVKCRLRDCEWSFKLKSLQERIVMQPNVSTYDPRTAIPSLKVCAGPICYSTDLQTKVLDRQGTEVLRDGLSNKINLTNLQCRSTVLISTSTDPKHLLPVQTKIGLNPVETFGCSEAPRYVPPNPSRPIDLCESESSYTKAVLANVTARTRAFANLTCKSSLPGVEFNALTMRLPNMLEIPRMFEIRCVLRDCQWIFKVNVDLDKLKLMPEKSAYDPLADAVSLKICRGPKCWAGPFNTSILDANNHLLRGNLTKESVSLRGLYCRNEVHLVAQDKDVEAEPVRHTIQLYPVEQLNCSQTNIYITPASANRFIPLCSFTSAQQRDTFANEDVYNTFFEGIQCTSSVPGTRFTKRHLQLPNDNSTKRNYTIDCKLYGCQWEFRIFKQPETLKLFPEQSIYEQGPQMKIKLQVCLGPHCRTDGLKANLTDGSGQALIEGFSNSFTLNNIFCWHTVTLIATTPQEPEPVRRTITLSPTWGYECSKKDIFVTWGRIREPIVLCSPTTKETKAVLAKEEEFERIFKDAKCKCNRPGVTFSTRFLHLPSNASPPDNFSIHCQLHECQWSFLVRVVKEEIHLNPESDQYDPRNNTPISLRLCAGDVCRSTGINITIVDKHGSKLLEARKSSFSLYGFFCRSSVDLICQADGEPEAVNRTLRLHPLLTPECSRQDVYVAPGARTKPVRICNIVSRFEGKSLTSDSSENPFERMFGSVECTSEPPGNLTFAKAHVRISPNVRPPVEYLVKCRLRDCEWSFKLKSLQEHIVMQPNESTYDPRTALPSLKVCAGPICYSTDLQTKVLDRQGTEVLRDGLSNKINMTNLQCRSTVLISTSTDPKHLLPVQTKIDLKPMQTFECSEAPRFIPPKPPRPLDLCKSESSYTKALLANVTARMIAFTDLACNSSLPGVEFNGLSMRLPKMMEIPSVFEIRCFLYDCQWMFKVNVDLDKLKLIPEKSAYDPLADAVSLQICRGPKCWAGPFNTSILETNNHLLRGNLTKEPVPLRGLYCRNEVHLVAQDKDVEAEPVRHTIQLYPVEQLNCSQTNIYITPASANRFIPICSFTSAQQRDTFANEDVYNIFFEGIQCTSSVPGTRFTKRHLQLPTDNLSKQNYTIDCKLYGCQWEFWIFKQPETLKLFPEKSIYEQGPQTKIKLQVCLGPHCRTDGLKANLTDGSGQALIVGISDSFTLNNIFCWHTVTLIATTPQEPEPVRRTITLSPTWGYECSKKDIFVTWGRIREPIVLCSPTTKETKAVLAKEEEFERIFKDARCKCNRPGVTFSTRFLHLPSNASPPDNFSIHCQLHECQWSFLVRVVKEEIHLNPESDQYDPRNNTPISLRLCAGDVCRSTGINITIVDKHGSKLLEARKSSFSLYGFFCRSSVDLSCQADGEPEASNRTLRLHPLLTPECSRQDVYVAPGARTKPVRICNIMSRFERESLASDSSENPFERLFGSVECTSEPPGNLTFAKAHVRISPNVRPPVEYLVKCRLRDCEWSFKLKSLQEHIVMQPNESTYDPRTALPSLKVCAGPICYSTDLQTKVLDRQGTEVLRDGLSNKINLTNLQCRSTVLISTSTDPKHLLPVQTKISLNPMQTFECSEAPRYIPPKPPRPLDLCKSESSYTKALLANVTARMMAFTDLACNSSLPGVEFNGLSMRLPKMMEIPSVFEIRCFLYDCRWMFKVNVDLDKLKLIPEKSAYDPAVDAISLQICRGPKCWAGPFSKSIFDTNNHLLRGNLTKEPVSLRGLYCRKEVHLVAQDKDVEAEPVRHTIQLYPVEQLNCSQTDIYITPASATKPIPLCLFTSAQLRDTFANEDVYNTFFEGIQCTSSHPGTRFTKSHLKLPTGNLSEQDYSIDCKLYECHWKFRIFKQPETLKLFPEKSIYEQGPQMKIKLQVCLGPHCRTDGLKANLTDGSGQALIEGFSDSFTLNNIFCWHTVTLIATTPQEPEPVRRTITLSPTWGYECSKKDIFVTWGRIREPIVLCSPTSKETKAVLAKEEEFERIFKDARCKCNRPGVTFSTRFLHLPSNASPPDNFSIHCQLHECQWSFLVRVVKEEIRLSPDRDRYDPRNNTLISLRLCAGDICRSDGIKITITDRYGDKLLEARKSKFSLQGIFCRSSVDLSCQADGEPEPSNRTLQLHPLLTPECSRETVYILSAAYARPIRICRTKSKLVRDLIVTNNEKGSEDRFQRLFDAAICTSEPLGILTIDRSRVIIPPYLKPPLEFLVKCTLRDCEWSFKIMDLEDVIVLQPEASAYDPQTARPTLKVCSGPLCYATNLRTRILDRQGTTVLRDGLSTKIDLSNLHCRASVMLSARTDLEDSRVDRTIDLKPMQTYECSEKPRYSPPKPSMPLDLCESNSLLTKAVLANFTARTTAFANLTCNSSKPGVEFNGLSMRLPRQMDIPSVVEIRCLLHDCQWMFKVIVDLDKLKLIPEKSAYDPLTDVVSLKICRGPNCWAGPFRTNISDTNNHLLRSNPKKDTVSLQELYCRTEVCLVAQDHDEKAEPVRRNITLKPTEQLNCSQTDIYVTPALAPNPILLCSLSSAKLRDTFASEDVYNTFFEGIQCTSSHPGTRFTKSHLQLPTDNLSKQDYSIDCKLYGCHWGFRIFKQPERLLFNPERKYYGTDRDNVTLQACLGPHCYEGPLHTKVFDRYGVLLTEQTKPVLLPNSYLCVSELVIVVKSPRDSQNLTRNLTISPMRSCRCEEQPIYQTPKMALRPVQLCQPHNASAFQAVLQGKAYEEVFKHSVCNSSCVGLKLEKATATFENISFLPKPPASLKCQVSCRLHDCQWKVDLIVEDEKLVPKSPQSSYNPKLDEIEMQLCLSKKCRSEGLRISILSEGGMVLATDLRGAFSLKLFFCQTELTLEGQVDGEPERRQTRIKLAPMLTYNCSEESRILTPVEATRIQRLCSSRDQGIKSALSFDKVYIRVFNDANCTTTSAAVNISAAMAVLPEAPPSDEKYSFDCRLLACKWNLDMFVEHERVKLTPNKKRFDPVKENISIEVCHRDSCRSSGFNTSLRDTQGVLLMDKLTNLVPLTQQFCRSAVTISCHPEGELKPIDTQITLSPVQTYQCSSEDIIIPSYLTSEPVKLCSSKDLIISRALARDEDYAAHFTDAVCQTPTSGLRLNSAVAWFLKHTNELEIYPLTCTLRNCTWNVTIIKGKEYIDVLPKKEVYNPAEDELSPRLCVWNACRSSNLSLALVDKNDEVIETQVDNKLAPMSLVCRSLVILVRRPIRGTAATLLTHNIALSPMRTYACANRDFFISPKALIAAKKRIRICLLTGSAENKVSESEGHVHPADNETLYKTQFKDVICNSTKTGIRFAQGFAIFEEVDDSREEYPVECRLYECIWGFLIVKSKKELIVTPTKDFYKPYADKITVKVCEGSVCMTEIPKIDVLDDKRKKINEHIEQPIVLNPYYCRSAITLTVAIDNLEKTIYLAPVQHFACQNVIVVDAAMAKKPIRVCETLSRSLQGPLRSEKLYKALFQNATCSSLSSEITFSSGYAHVSATAPVRADFQVHCHLGDCEWDFTIEKRNKPYRSRCSWTARPAQRLPFITDPFLVGCVLTGVILFFLSIVYIKMYLNRRKRRRSRRRSSSRVPTTERGILRHINRAGHNSIADDPNILQAYTAVLENYSEENHRRLKEFLLKHPKAERPVFQCEVRRRRPVWEDITDS